MKSGELIVCLFLGWFARSPLSGVDPRHLDPFFVQQSQASVRPVAVATERIQRNGRQIRVRRAKRFVRLPYFIELLVATPVGGQVPLAGLVGEKVGLQPSDKHQDQWEVRRDIIGGVLDLPENVFVVKQVFISTAKDPIEVCGFRGKSVTIPRSSRSAFRNDAGHDSGMNPVSDSDFKPVTFGWLSEP
jgi:hypothetical protein